MITELQVLGEDARAYFIRPASLGGGGRNGDGVRGGAGVSETTRSRTRATRSRSPPVFQASAYR